MEWVDPSGLGTHGVLPAAGGAAYYIGSYATADGVFLNPLTGGVSGDTTWTASDVAFSYSDRDPALRPAGSLGTAVYYTQQEGLLKDTVTTELDSAVLMRYWEEKK